MALYGVETTISFVAWDTSANVGKTGDDGNFTLRWIKDGTSGAPSNSPSEVDATNAPGVYKLTLTAAECQAVYGTLAGKSNTANVSIMPVSIAFERLPNAAPGSNGGLPTVDGSNRLAGIQGSKNTLDDLTDLSEAQVNAQCDQALTDYDAVARSDLPANFADLAVTASTGRVTVGTNADKTGYELSGTITTLDGLGTQLAADHGSGSWETATGFAQPGDPVTLGTTERNAVADAVLARDMSHVEAVAPEHSLCTVVLATLESAVSAGTWTIKQTDGSTVHATKKIGRAHV